MIKVISQLDQTIHNKLKFLVLCWAGTRIFCAAWAILLDLHNTRECPTLYPLIKEVM